MKQFYKIIAICLLFTFVLTGCGEAAVGSQGSPAIVQTTVSPAEAEETAVPEATPPQVSVIPEDDSPSEAAPENTANFFDTTWEIWDYQFCSVVAMTAEDAEQYRGYTLSYSEDAVIQNGTDLGLGDISYQYEQPVTEDDIVQNYKANLAEWWSGIDQVTPVAIDSDSDFFGEYVFLVSDEVIWIFCDGCFFLARNESQSAG